jgi:phosphohistidine phosphatase
MDLILWRHADAEDGPYDMERALTPKGVRQAQRVGQWLNHKLPESCQILVSPARRAVQTAQAIGRKFTIVNALAPNAHPEALLLAANWPNSLEPVLLVGHQPTLGQVAALLLAENEQDWNVRKANVWWMSQRGEAPNIKTFLKLVTSPEFIEK